MYICQCYFPRNPDLNPMPFGGKKKKKKKKKPIYQCQCKRYKRRKCNPWVRKILWGRKWQPTPVFLPGESHGQRSLMGYSLWGLRVGHNWSDLAHIDWHACSLSSRRKSHSPGSSNPQMTFNSSASLHWAPRLLSVSNNSFQNVLWSEKLKDTPPPKGPELLPRATSHD